MSEINWASVTKSVNERYGTRLMDYEVRELAEKAHDKGFRSSLREHLESQGFSTEAITKALQDHKELIETRQEEALQSTIKVLVERSALPSRKRKRSELNGQGNTGDIRRDWAGRRITDDD